MKPFLLALLLLLQTTTSAVTNGGGSTTRGSAASSVLPPTMTYRYQSDAVGNTCGTTGASSCTTNAQALFSLADLADSSPLSQATTANQPTFITNAINTSLPAAAFSGSSQYLAFGTPIPTSVSNYVFYVVVKFTATDSYVFGGASSGTWMYRYTTSSQMDFVLTDTADIANSGTTFALNTWYTMVLSFSLSGVSFSHCSAGSLVADNSASNGYTASNPIQHVGADVADSVYMHGNIAEFGYLNGTSTAGICAWTQAHWGV